MRSLCIFFFKETATTEIYTYYTLFPYTTLFRSLVREIPDRLDAAGGGIGGVIGRAGFGVGSCPRYSVIPARAGISPVRSEEHTYELQSLMRISYAVFCLKKKQKNNIFTRAHSATHTNTNRHCITLHYVFNTTLTSRNL